MPALACERTAHPLLLHCLQNLDHDWRRLALVNRAMAAAFRLYAPEVAAHTAQRQLREAWAQLSTALHPPHDCWAFRIYHDGGPHDPLARLMAEFEAMPSLHTAV